VRPLRSAYRFPVHHGHVLVPLQLVRTDADLAWCLAWKHTLNTRLTRGRMISVLHVPVVEWAEHWEA
jgi:hypothetical protein